MDTIKIQHLALRPQCNLHREIIGDQTEERAATAFDLGSGLIQLIEWSLYRALDADARDGFSREPGRLWFRDGSERRHNFIRRRTGDNAQRLVCVALKRQQSAMHRIEGCICRLQHDPAYLGSVTIEPYMAVILTLHPEGIDVVGYYL